jgi:hypothetical protein
MMTSASSAAAGRLRALSVVSLALTTVVLMMSPPGIQRFPFGRIKRLKIGKSNNVWKIRAKNLNNISLLLEELCKKSEKTAKKS